MSRDVLHEIAAVTRREQTLATASARYPAGVTDTPDKLRAIDEAVAAFGDAGIPYALIGGVAVGIRSGVPRATLDEQVEGAGAHAPREGNKPRSAAGPLSASGYPADHVCGRGHADSRLQMNAAVDLAYSCP